MATNISTHLKKLIKEENEKKFLFVHEKIVLDFVENYNLNPIFIFNNILLITFLEKVLNIFWKKIL